MGDEHLDTIPATKSDEVIKSSVEDLVSIPSESEALKDNPTPSSKLFTKSSSTSSKSFLEETNSFHNSLPKFENFFFNLEEISSGSTTTHSDISLFEYESFVFDPSNDQFPPTDRSNFANEEFADELAHIISPPKYDCFYFKNFPDPGELISIFNFEIRKNPSTTCVNLPIEADYSPLLAYVVWIFLAYLTYPIIPPYLHSFGNEDTIFDPGITINHVYSFKPGLSHRCGAFKKFNTHLVQYSQKLEDSCQSILSSKSSIPLLQLGINDDDSLHEENIEYVEASPHDSELVSLEVAEIVILEVKEIEDDNLREKLLNVHLLIANIEALKDNPTPSSELLTKSSSTSLNSLLEETNIFHNFLPEFENFYFDLEEISSGSTTTHSDISLPDYEAFSFDDDHIKEISSGSTTTHSDISLPDYEAFSFDDDHIKEISSGSPTTPSDISLSEYDSFIFDFTHKEFADELAHIISPP
nr:hypothetical protein [Tanacetum cinerariifolium]